MQGFFTGGLTNISPLQLWARAKLFVNCYTVYISKTMQIPVAHKVSISKMSIWPYLRFPFSNTSSDVNFLSLKMLNKIPLLPE